jgi:hypothetical protein
MFRVRTRGCRRGIRQFHNEISQFRVVFQSFRILLAGGWIVTIILLIRIYQLTIVMLN